MKRLDAAVVKNSISVTLNQLSESLRAFRTLDQLQLEFVLVQFTFLRPEAERSLIVCHQRMFGVREERGVLGGSCPKHDHVPSAVTLSSGVRRSRAMAIRQAITIGSSTSNRECNCDGGTGNGNGSRGSD